MRNNFFILGILIVLCLVGCKKAEDISGSLDGVWSTEWDDVLDGDLDDLRVYESIFFKSNDKDGDNGTFNQYFGGTVEYDDWENETEVEYAVWITGTWEIKDRNNVGLHYDIKEMDVYVGEAGFEGDYTEAARAFLNGDFGGMLLNAPNTKEVKKLNNKAESEVERQITTYFRDMFHEINKDKEGFTNVVIDGDMMTCDVNHGFFGREQIYDKNYDKEWEAFMADEEAYYDYSDDETEYSGNSGNVYAYDYIEGDAPIEVMYEMEGSIGEYPIVMEATLFNEEQIDYARYRYTKTGSGDWFELEISNDNNDNLVLTEYTNGEVTGKFVGEVSLYNGELYYEGTYTNYKGKTFHFFLKGEEIL